MLIELSNLIFFLLSPKQNYLGTLKQNKKKNPKSAVW